MASKKISYIYHDPSNTIVYWQGFTQVFDDTVITVADKVAEQRDLRTMGGNSTSFFKFVAIDGVFLDNQNQT